MKTKESDEQKVAASQKVYAALGKACVIAVRYIKDGVMAYGVYADGVTEYLFIPYDTEGSGVGQHDLARKYIENMNPEERFPW